MGDSSNWPSQDVISVRLRREGWNDVKITVRGPDVTTGHFYVYHDTLDINSAVVTFKTLKHRPSQDRAVAYFERYVNKMIRAGWFPTYADGKEFGSVTL